MSRLKKLQNSLHNQEYEALLVSQSENIRYLSSFSGSNGWLFITEKHAFLATDFRYIEQAKSQAPEFQIVKVKASTGPWLLSLAGDLAIHRIGFEDTVVSYADYQKLIAPLSKNASVITFMPANNIVEMLRIIKGTDEIENIRHAARLADDAIAFAATLIRTGVTEREIAWSIEKYLRENGSQKLPFDIIVASGPNAALPHASPGDRILENGDPVVIDLGATCNGYCSDMTRTFCCGNPDSMFHKIYDITLCAQLTAIAEITEEMSGHLADNIARTVITETQYGDFFGHSLGHGIGLAVHELPRLGPDSTDILHNNMVFSIEPGIYIPGWGGVRIEDTVILENGKIKTLTTANKNIA